MSKLPESGPVRTSGPISKSPKDSFSGKLRPAEKKSFDEVLEDVRKAGEKVIKKLDPDKLYLTGSQLDISCNDPEDHEFYKIAKHIVMHPAGGSFSESADTVDETKKQVTNKFNTFINEREQVLFAISKGINLNSDNEPFSGEPLPDLPEKAKKANKKLSDALAEAMVGELEKYRDSVNRGKKGGKSSTVGFSDL